MLGNAIAIDACAACGAVAEITSETGRRAVLVTARVTPRRSLAIECAVCGGAVVGPKGVPFDPTRWAPEPHEVDELIRAAWPGLAPSVKTWIPADERRWRVELLRLGTDEEAV